jgi:hypothetical protein
MKTCDFHQMTSFLGITWPIQSKFKKNNKTALLNQTNLVPVETCKNEKVINKYEYG